MKPNRTKLHLSLLFIAFGAQVACGFYDPNVQRWINRDPIEESGGINLYVFIRNDSINNADPDGRLCLGVTICRLTSPIKGATCTFSCTTYCCVAPRKRGPVTATITAPLGLGICPPLVYWPEL